MSLNEGGVGEIAAVPRPFLKHLHRPEIRRIVSNTGWLAGDRLIRLGVGLFVTSWIARYLGRDQFGLLNYAIAFVYLFSVLGALGLDSIVIRDLIRDPESKDRLLCTTFFLKLSGGILSFVLSLSAIFYMHADRTTTALVAILGFGTVIQSTDTIDFWFQSQVKSKWSVLSRNCAFFLMSLFKIVLLSLHAGIIWFAVATVLELAIAAGGMIFYLFKLGGAPRSWSPDFKLARQLLTQGWPLFLSGVSIMVYMRIDQVMLDKMAGQGAVGLYSAAVRVSEIFYFIPAAIASSLLPALIRSRSLGEDVYMSRMQRYLDLNAVLAYALVLPISLFSPWIVHILFGSNYTGTAAILTVHIWGSIFVFLGIGRGQYLLNEGYLNFSMWSTMSGAVANILLNLFLIPRYGAFGAAFATLISYAISAVFSSFVVKDTYRIGVMQLRAMIIPFNVMRLLRAYTE